VQEVAPKRFLVYLTGDSEDQRLLEFVEKLSYRPNTEVTLTYVVEVDQAMPLDAELPQEIERGEDVLHGAEMIAARCVANRAMVNTELLQARSAGAAIVDEAVETDATAILMSCRLRKKHGRVTTGETLDYVLRHAPCEVVVIRQKLDTTRVD
jgi:nucleotide-binding universal stress UspA family protein